MAVGKPRTLVRQLVGGITVSARAIRSLDQKCGCESNGFGSPCHRDSSMVNDCRDAWRPAHPRRVSQSLAQLSSASVDLEGEPTFEHELPQGLVRRLRLASDYQQVVSSRLPRREGWYPPLRA